MALGRTIRGLALAAVAWAAAAFLVANVAVSCAASPEALSSAVGAELPQRLTDQQFWQLSSSYSEPGGTFHSDNFVSNEGRFQTVIPELLKRARQGGFYIGVGPEQNFTYIAALRPRMAFIVDIRRGNFQEHLLYKALMEMSTDRADFLARLFSRLPPAGLGPTSTVEQLFAALESVSPTEERYRINLQAVFDWLTKRHTFILSQEDRAGIDYIFRAAFYADGPALNYQLTGQGRMGGRGRGPGTPTYAELMAMDDGMGRQRSYLASEDSFAFLKDLETRNLIVPVVGDFAGPKALRAVGRYAREQGVAIGAFYVSNVEQYLRQDGKWDAFCATVALMPLDASSTLIRTVRGGGGGTTMFTSSLANIQAETRACAIH